MIVAKTEASGGAQLLPEVLAFSSSLSLDRALLREDLLGSLAHLTMLSRRRIVPRAAAEQIRAALLALWNEVEQGALTLPQEEDVHMAVEAELARRLGEPAGLLHTARSRNDQVALDLRLHVRERCAEILEALAGLVGMLADRAEAERDTVLPSYTHRQRAQPISLAYWLCAYGSMFARDAEAFAFVSSQADALPLGVGAIAGTSLPTDRAITRELLRFSRLTLNGLDTVGDRDFALDYAYAAARFLVHASRLATDLIDFTTAEFGYARLEGEIACGSSMMPQKRNPDVFELIRGKTGQAVGNLVGLLMTVKGLPAGYNRDLQEDRAPLLETGPMVGGVLSILGISLPRVIFDRDRCRAAVEGDMMQATDLAEALVKKGVPFRTAYQAVGSLVRRCQEGGFPLAAATLEMARQVDPRFDAEVLQAANPLASVGRKISAGSTGPAAVEQQLAELRQSAAAARDQANRIPRLQALFRDIQEASL
ncbi:MAG TPA: argininosuccinate lyase [Myxococcaceae bacterium]|nr:argininosuccinate lyase [Myxococcaceae bacterium]